MTFFNPLATATFRHFVVKRRTSRLYVNLKVARREKEFLSQKIPRYTSSVRLNRYQSNKIELQLNSVWDLLKFLCRNSHVGECGSFSNNPLSKKFNNPIFHFIFRTSNQGSIWSVNNMFPNHSSLTVSSLTWEYTS